MKVIFWIKEFPSYSETFIRDQIVALLDKNIEIVIYTKNGKVNISELKALSGFESYHLEDIIVDIDTCFELNRIKRLLKAIPIFIISFFKGHARYYYRSLNYKKYGAHSKSLRLFYRLHFFLTNNIDIIHAHYGPCGNEAFIFKQLGIPLKLFVTFHGYDIRLGQKKGGHIYKALFTHADGIISISEFNTLNLLQFGLHKNKLIYLVNGIDVSFFKPIHPRDYKNPIKLLSVARLVDEKALHIAIKAVSEVVREDLDIQFQYHIVGEGEKRYDLEKLIKTLKLEQTIILTGSKTSEEVKDMMLNSDIFLLSSIEEALPTVLLEAQACGMVVLATDVGAVKDIVKSGMVVTDADYQAFKNGLLLVLESKDVWSEMTKQGREFIIKYYNLKDVSTKLVELYNK